MCIYVCMQFFTFHAFIVHRVRLTDGPNPRAGRVEVYTNSIGGLDSGEWGTVCDDSWDIQDARVVCRQLGYPNAVAALSSAHNGQGSPPIWFDGVQCLGNELDLFECMHSGIAYHRCNDNDASVECSGTYTIIHMHIGLNLIAI